MTKKDSKEKNKKKTIILVLLLFAVVGIAGYGVYSYFWTEGSFDGYSSSTISVASFDPQVNVAGFVGEGGTVTLTCPDSETGNETIECTGTVTVTNNGGSDITVSASHGVPTVTPINHDSASATAGTPTFDWSSTTISSGYSSELTITVPVTITSDFGSSSSVETNQPYHIDDETKSAPDAFEVKVAFDITAAQVHD